MVSFSCEGCGDVLTKKKLDGHRNQCRGATFTCLDCMVHFWGTEYKAHTSCISEAQKYQGALYKPEKQKGKQNQNQNNKQQQQPQKASVEDVKENAVAVVSAPPEAPMPPSAVAENVNVFDYMVGQETPNQSTVNLLATAAKTEAPGAMVRFEAQDALVQTPAPKKAKKAKTPATTEPKSDKKRKRLHVDTSGSSSMDRDLEMTDAPPVLHSGLTGGLQKMMSIDFPPTPDLSGDAEDKTEETPVKRKKSKRHSSEGSMGLALMRMVTNTSSKKVKKSKSTDEERPRKHQKKTKAIEYNPSAGEEGTAVEVFRPNVEPDALASMLLAFVETENDKGITVSKALKRYHRMRASEGGVSKAVEEKELWKALRMKKNDRGEIVLFF